VEVILLETIDSLGRKGAVVKVRNGYGRNYLLPYRKAIPVNADNLNRLKTLKKKFDAEEALLVKELSQVADALEGMTLTLTVKSTAEGHLFGSVTPAMIVRELAAQGYKIGERSVRLAEPIKAVGTYSVGIRLHLDVSTKISVIVVGEGMEAVEPEVEPEAPAEEASAATAGEGGEEAPAAE
jgi:large subunit ribosomal protein L9